MWIWPFKESKMEDKKKTVPEQFGQIALGFAQIIRQIDGEKLAILQQKRTKKK